MSRDGIAQKNKRVLIGTLSVVAAMIALAFASVPLYDMFCRVTGWGGTTQIVAANTSDRIYDREITVRFNTGVARNMPWDFKPDMKSVKVKVGQDGLIAFSATNLAAQPVTGTAIYNVTPLKAGKYFYKTQCFCFDEQTLAPGKTEHMPVTFFIDPEILKNRDMDDVNTITLSYTFFRKNSAELEAAKEKFYNNDDSGS
ncbi:MAG TPA: cytochrome c oxidase assembly protein [Alphaproteobacteria bacterium]|nr:cytochrome c oxidase assembly protein [Alphaproteobacteria bacterium]